MEASQPEQYDLEAGAELRFELEEDEAIAIKVESDSPVFINYQEIPSKTWYPLYGELKAAIWCPYGATIQATTAPSTCYTSTSSTYPFILSLHLALERIRILARRSHRNGSNPSEAGPRVMVIGPSNSGKSTVAKSLLNLALSAGMGWSVGVAGLDAANPPHLVPGSISLSTPTQALPTHHPVHYLGSTPTTASAVTMSSDVSTLAWWVGQTQLGGKTRFVLWKKLVEQMADDWEKRCDRDETCRASGIIIDTPASFTVPGLGTAKGDRTRYSIVRHAIEALKVDLLLVIGNEKLAIEMEKLFSPAGVQVLRVTKSSGVVDVEEQYRRRIQSRQIRSYFYGETALPAVLKNLPDARTIAIEAPLHPYSFTISWDDLEIYRVGEEASAPSSALPIGKQTALSPTRLSKVDPAAPANIHRLSNAVLALVLVSNSDMLHDRQIKVKKEKEDAEKKEQETVEANGEDSKPAVESVDETREDEDEDEEPRWEEHISWREVVGFVSIAGIDTAKRKFTVLSPSPGKLPTKVAIAGAIEWLEDE